MCGLKCKLFNNQNQLIKFMITMVKIFLIAVLFLFVNQFVDIVYNLVLNILTIENFFDNLSLFVGNFGTEKN